MSKPMTEARLSEIEAGLASPLHRPTDELGYELIAEVRRLRECIKNAPHAETCSLVKYDYATLENACFPTLKCDCEIQDWQRQALGEQ